MAHYDPSNINDGNSQLNISAYQLEQTDCDLIGNTLNDQSPPEIEEE